MTNFLECNPEFGANASANANKLFHHSLLSLVITHVHADPDNWRWPNDAKVCWEAALGKWQAFAKKWRSAESTFDSVSRQLDVGSGIQLQVPRPFFVRNVYLEAEKLFWRTAKERPQTGVILTGHPGIGKTLFLWFLLVRLLQMKQVVLLNTPSICLLFYCDQVYMPKTTLGPDFLPEFVMSSSMASGAMAPPNPKPLPFIWSLFDIHKDQPVPQIALGHCCFPVQSPSPNPIRYHEWQKERSALYTGFPLWTCEELALAARHDPEFQTLSGAILTEKLKQISEAYPHENFLEDMPAEGEQLFEILLDRLIWCFGYVPRDIFTAMYINFETEVQRHRSALAVNYKDLKMAVEKLELTEQFLDAGSPSHRLISLDFVNGKWIIEFKSKFIEQQFLKKMRAESWMEVRKLIHYFLQVPATRDLGGKLFEPYMHRYICAGASDTCHERWQVRRLRCSDYDADAPMFSLDKNLTAVIPSFKTSARQWTFFGSELPELEENRYYVPGDPTHPLFDSFVVEFSQQFANLWILQMTASPQHRGSAKGYVVIRKIIKKIIQQFNSKAPLPKKRKVVPTVKVYYVLVCPAEGNDEECRPSWVFPKGWNESTTQIDHRGEGWLLGIPMGSRYFESLKL